MKSHEFQRSYQKLTSVTVVTDARTGKVIGTWHPGPPAAHPDTMPSRSDKSVRDLLSRINKG